MFATIVKDMEDYSYKVYVTDNLKATAGNLANSFGGESTSQRWYDIIEKSGEPIEDADEIKNRIKNKANGFT